MVRQVQRRGGGHFVPARGLNRRRTFMVPPSGPRRRTGARRRACRRSRVVRPTARRSTRQRGRPGRRWAPAAVDFPGSCGHHGYPVPDHRLRGLRPMASLLAQAAGSAACISNVGSLRSWWQPPGPEYDAPSSLNVPSKTLSKSRQRFRPPAGASASAQLASRVPQTSGGQTLGGAQQLDASRIFRRHW